MRTLMTLLMLGLFSGVAAAGSIYTEELWVWIIRWFVMQVGGDWS